MRVSNPSACRRLWGACLRMAAERLHVPEQPLLGVQGGHAVVHANRAIVGRIDADGYPSPRLGGNALSGERSGCNPRGHVSLLSSETTTHTDKSRLCRRSANCSTLPHPKVTKPPPRFAP